MLITFKMTRFDTKYLGHFGILLYLCKRQSVRTTEKQKLGRNSVNTI